MSNRRLEPEEILLDLLRLDPGLRVEPYYGERAIFFNPGRAAPLGTIFCAIKDHDGPNDRRAALSRSGVFRFAFGMAPESYERLLGPLPRRPPKGGVPDLARHDAARLDTLSPHPVYAWMGWAQILSPTAARFDGMRPLLAESLDLVRQKWKRRAA
jgi:hypothetical protein